MVIECKNCGSEIEVAKDKKTVVCDFCGMEQTVPKADDPKKIELFVKANEHRMACRFDIAKKQYESIISAYPDDNEAYWCKILCEYGIEYVEDFATERKLPTCHRTVTESIFNNRDYKLIIKRATKEEKAIYETEAKEIDRIQKDILDKAKREEAYDIFICFKDTTEINGVTKRTVDSQYANKIYTHFTNKGYRVFFSRVTLKSKAGSQYEPIIYSALMSAKVMLLVCANKNHVNAPWVRNEWNRFAEFAENDYTKVLVPCLKDVYPYDLPDELSQFQCLDMGELDFYENLSRQIGSKFGRLTENIRAQGVESKPDQVSDRQVIREYVSQPAEDKSTVINNYLRRSELFLEDGDWSKADEYAEKILDINPEYGCAYLVKLLVEYKLKSKQDLLTLSQPYESSKNYAKAVRFGDDATKGFLLGATREREVRKENARKDGIYKTALLKAESDGVDSWREAVDLFGQIAGWKDADKKSAECKSKIKAKLDAEEKQRLENKRKLEKERIERERKLEKERLAKEKEAEKARQKEIFEKAKTLAASASDTDVKKAIELFRSIPEYPGAAAKIPECERRIDIILKMRAKQAEDRARKEEEESRERVICEPLLRRFESLRGKAEIDAEISTNRDKLDGLVTKMGELKKTRTDYKEAMEERENIKGRIDEINALAVKLRSERSGLSIFAIKAKREIDAKLDDCVSERCRLESRLGAIERDWYLYKSVDEIDVAIKKQETEISLCNNEFGRLSNEQCKEDIKEELLKYGYGKRIIEDMERQKLEAFKNKFLNAKVGDLIAFGKSNYGDEKSNAPLYWRVLENKGNSVFVMANSIFTTMSYSSRLAGGDWHNCLVRTWLDRVYETAFSEDEKQYIVKKHLGSAESYLYPLSAEQVRKFLPDMEARKMGGDWWVRTVISSYTFDSVMYVNSMGRIVTAGKEVNRYCGVVPAMQLKFK